MKPCPFCRCEDTILDSDDDGNRWVVCMVCGACGPCVSSRAMAVELWDKALRVPVLELVEGGGA